VMTTWKKEYWKPEIIEMPQSRYDQIKEVGERNLKRHQNTIQDTSQILLPEVGRNELCPCGSGKKYKKCCGKKGMAVL
ncbi:SEC-C metal-binding domain-containing protein, partial [Deltaproteobacteria bacterium TL4]